MSSARVNPRVSAAIAAVLSLSAIRAPAQTTTQEPVQLNLPAQALADSLRELGLRTNTNFLLDPSLVRNLKAPALTGRLTVDNAILRLLSGTGLHYRFLDEHTVVLSLDGESPSPDAPEDSAPRPQSGDASQAPDDTEEIVVRSRVTFTQNDAFGATKMGLALRDTPQTVTVVTSDLMQVASLRTFNDFYKLDASGGTAHTFDGYPRNYYRGFFQQNAIRVDGFRVPGNMDLDLAVFDRFEVVKGATSTLYGQNGVGGTLNAVSKLPQNRFASQFGVEGGQFSDYRADADVTGPIGDGDRWSYRFIGAYEDADSFLDFSHNRLKLASASVRYVLDDSTRFTLRGTFQEKDIGLHFAEALQLAGDGSGPPASRVEAEGLRFIDVPRSRFYGMPWNDANMQARFIQFQGEHEFANDWTLRVHAQHNHVRFDSNALIVAGPFDQHGFAYFTSAYGRVQEDDLYGAEVDLFGKVEGFGREHTLFVGVDYNDLRSRYRHGSGAGFSFGFGNTLFNAYDPDYAAVPAIRSLAGYPDLDDFRSRSHFAGITTQLILHPTDRLSVLLGGRYSVDTLFTEARAGSQSGDAAIDAQEFSTGADNRFKEMVYQTGLTYELTSTVNLYASLGQTFEPKTDRVFDGTPAGKLIAAERGLAREVGVKAEWSRDLSMTLALFDMDRSNISQPDTNPDHAGFAVAFGTQRGRGVELGAQGRILPQVSIFASLAYLDAQFTEGLYKGLQPANAPRFGASLFGTYEVLRGPLKGLGYGLGVVHKSGRRSFDADWVPPATSAPVVFDFGDYTEVDARVFYGLRNWNLTLSMTNAFDEKYYSPSYNQFDFGTHVNPPRTLTARISWKL